MVWSASEIGTLTELYYVLIAASIYVVRKIRASIKEGEQTEEPIFTPCSLAKGEIRSSKPGVQATQNLTFWFP